LEFFHETFEADVAAAASPRSSSSSKVKSQAAQLRRRGPLLPDVLVFNTLLRGFVDAGKLSQAFDVLEWMQSKYGVRPSEVTWALLMEGVATHGGRAEWRSLLARLAEEYPGMGWRAPSLLDRHSFVRWSLRAAARMGYALPQELRVLVEEQSNTLSTTPTSTASQLQSNATSTSTAGDVTFKSLTRSDFFEIIDSIRVSPRPSASSTSSPPAPVSSAKSTRTSSSHFAGSELLDTHWLSACSFILYAAGLRRLPTSLWPDASSSDPANHWLVCAQALTPEAATHVLTGITKRTGVPNVITHSFSMLHSSYSFISDLSTSHSFCSVA
jgi:pentatricopeptide repeat protein